MVVVAGVLGGVETLSADTASAQLTVGVTVVRSCAVNARAFPYASPTLRLTCTGGANATLRLSETPQPAPVVGADSLHVFTLNF